MKAGATYNLMIKVPDVTDSSMDIISKIIFTLQNNAGNQIQKVYPDEVTLMQDIFIVPLSQDDTETLVGMVKLEAQINYANNAVQKSYLKTFSISETLATEKVEGGKPDSVHNLELLLKIIGSDTLVVDINPELAEQLITEINKIYLNMQQLQADVQDYVDTAKQDIARQQSQAIDSIISQKDASLTSISEVTNAKIGDINNIANSQINAINTTAASQLQAMSQSIDALVNAKINDIQSIVDAKIGDINNTAVAQINAINSSATAAIDSANKSIAQAGQAQVYGINQVATGKIANINTIAQSQIDAINRTAQAQASALDTQAERIMTNLGIKSGTLTGVTRTAIEGLDISQYKYISFGYFTLATSLTTSLTNLLPQPNYLSAVLRKIKEGSVVENISITSNTYYDVSDCDSIEILLDYISGPDYDFTLDYALSRY